MSRFVIEVIVSTSSGEIIRSYLMDYNDPAELRVLGEQCRNALEAGLTVCTQPARKKRHG